MSADDKKTSPAPKNGAVEKKAGGNPLTSGDADIAS